MKGLASPYCVLENHLTTVVAGAQVAGQSTATQTVERGQAIVWGENEVVNCDAIQNAPYNPYISLRPCQTYLATYSISADSELPLGTIGLAFQLNGVTVFGSITQTTKKYF